MPLSSEQLRRLATHHPTLSVQASCTVLNSHFGSNVKLGDAASVQWSLLADGVTVGMRSSARCSTASGRFSLRAMLMPYDRPGIPFTRRYVGASNSASNWSDAFTMPSTSAARSFSAPRCVVAMVTVFRAASA